jgi:hypothetical protein
MMYLDALFFEQVAFLDDSCVVSVSGNVVVVGALMPSPHGEVAADGHGCRVTDDNSSTSFTFTPSPVLGFPTPLFASYD